MNVSPDALLERYKNGEGEEQERLSWLEQAVDAGSPEAMCILGGLYQSGMGGVDRSLKKASELFNRALKSGYDGAYTSLGLLYETSYDDLPKAMEYYRKGREAGVVPCTANLGRMDYFGKGGPVDYTQALALSLEAARKGDRQGMYLTGWILYLGNGIEPDPQQALYWFSKCCRDYPDAMRIVGILRMEKDTPYYDMYKGIAAMKIAASKNDPEAVKRMENIGLDVDIHSLPDDYFEPPRIDAYEGAGSDAGKPDGEWKKGFLSRFRKG